MRLIGAAVATSPRSFPESLQPLVRRVRLACSQEVEGEHGGFEVTIRRYLEVKGCQSLYPIKLPRSHNPPKTSQPSSNRALSLASIT